VNENPDGILGNLPRSRPGVRSEKRAGGASPQKRTPAKAKPAAAKPRAVKASKAAPPPPRAGPPPPKPAPPKPAATGGDSIERAVHLVGDVAETSIKVVAKVAGGVLRRLPRP
jgi:hypothetical protein